MDDDASTSSTKEYYKDLCIKLTNKVYKQHAKINKLKRENRELKAVLQVKHELERVRVISCQDKEGDGFDDFSRGY